MVAEVEQALCHVHCGYAGRLVAQAVEHEFVLAQALDGQFVYVFQAFLYVVGVERCERPYHLQVFPTERQDVGIRFHVNAEVAEECAHADVAFAACLNVVFVPVLHHSWLGQELFQSSPYADRTASRAASSVRGGESFVQVDVHNVEAHVARAARAEHWVEVRTVVVHQCAALVHHFGYLRDAWFEQAERVGVCHHHRRNSVVEQSAQVFDVNRAVGGALHFDNFKSADRSRGWVCAVGGVRHDDLCPLHVAAALVVGTDNHQSCQLAMCPGKGVEGKLGQAGDGRQRPLQVVVDGQYALTGVRGLRRMGGCKFLPCGHFLIDVGVVLHCAATKWVEAVVHSEVVAAHVGVVAHYGKLVAFGQVGIFLALHVRRQLVAAVCVFRQRASPASLVRQLEYQFAIQFVVHFLTVKGL